MRSLAETRSRWNKTKEWTRDVSGLRQATRQDGLDSPCVTGCRSICWKVFHLQWKQDAQSNWMETLKKARQDYASQRDRLLQYIKHPEALAQLTIDPLTADPASPWNTIRQDEVVRAEIQQDVERLPDEATYHDPQVQDMILDILFVYCKTNPSRGGYRQGMHELLAPIVQVVEQDSVDRGSTPEGDEEGTEMLEALDKAYVEHDAYILFSCVMNGASSFYEIREGLPSSTTQPSGKAHPAEQVSAIVELSQHVHEVYLAKADPELAAHLNNIEILPQIFLIRWVRLLFSREFPLDESLLLWDAIFAVDPTLSLVTSICVAMLLRIRWQLLEANYSSCLQLLLKYPALPDGHGPQTLVDDAVYLRSHMDTAGGSFLIRKYSGKSPSTITPSSDDSFGALSQSSRLGSTLRSTGFGARSPVISPSRFLQQQGGVEALLQKGAKGVLERGEKLGFNQAVRDAVGEIRKNMQNLNDSRQGPAPTPREVLSQQGGAKAVAAMEQRNKQLGVMLSDTVASLKQLSGTELDDKPAMVEAIELAAAKVQFVQIYLEDPTMDLPVIETTDKVSKDPDVSTSDAPSQEKVTENPGGTRQASDLAPPKDQHPPQPQTPDEQDTDKVQSPKDDERTAGASKDPVSETPKPKPADKLARPPAVPTRSTLAQSSFSWMLEPDESAPKQAPAASQQARSPPTAAATQKRRNKNMSRDKNAFLFGEVSGDSPEEDGHGNRRGSEIFGLENLRKGEGDEE